MYIEELMPRRPPKKTSREPAPKRKPSARIKPTFRLYVTADDGPSTRALRTLEKICREHFGNCQIEVVDALKQPARARQDAVATTPTLVKVAPPPVWRIVGDLSEEASILEAMKGAPSSDERDAYPKED
jgi:circadian clock protein KaiB